MRAGLRKSGWWRGLAGSFGLMASTWSGTHAQGPPTPLPGLPATSTPTGPASPGVPTVAELLERLGAMEELNRRLVDRLERADRQHGEEMRLVLERVEELSRRLDGGGADGGGAGSVRPSWERPSDLTVPPGAFDNQPDDPGSPVPDYRDGAATPDFPLPPGRPPNLIDPTRLPLEASFGPGFQLQTRDQEFLLQVELESQIEARLWSPSRRVIANSGIYLPRQRVFFRGRITKPVEYELSINRGLNNINLLNAYINLHFDDRLELRFGRFFTPVNYDQFAISNYWLPTPERSLFTTNLGLNRQVGLMAWGYLLDKRLDYAVGIFNGSRNTFENLDNYMDGAAYLNLRPFQDSRRFGFARYLNLGGSVAFGRQEQPPVPASFRIGAGSPDAAIPGIATVPFLILDRGVVEEGNRLVGSAHAAYFYRGLSVIGEWQFGHGTYASAARPTPRRVPYSGFYVSTGLFLTGEEAERRTRIRPLRPFIPLEQGQPRGPGAWEAVARVSQLRLGQEVFEAGFADPNLWSDSAVTTELGLNWYWNDYVKLYMFWLRGSFGDPVQFARDYRREDVDMFWLRFQLYY